MNWLLDTARDLAAALRPDPTRAEDRRRRRSMFGRELTDLRALGCSDREATLVCMAAEQAHRRTGAAWPALMRAGVHAIAHGIQPTQMHRHLLLIARLSTYQAQARPVADVASVLHLAIGTGVATAGDVLVIARWGIDPNRLDELLGGPGSTQDLLSRAGRREITTPALITALHHITNHDGRGC